MKRIPLMALAALTLAALMLAAPAVAQGPGQSGMSTGAPQQNLNAFKELLAFGACFANNQRKDALKIISTTPGTREEKKLFDTLIYGERYSCMFAGDKMQFSTIYARGIVAEGLLRTGGVPEEYRLAAPAVGEAKDLQGVARCYAVNHSSEVRALLATEAGSAKEVSAVAALWENFRTCMPGFKVRLNAPWIRFLLAEAALRLPPGTPSSGN